MSQRIVMQGCQIMSMTALQRALEHIQGAKLTLQNTIYQIGSIDLSANELMSAARLPSYGRSLNLRFVPSDKSSPLPVYDANQVIQNGYAALDIDGDYRPLIEKIIGTNGQRLTEYYEREVAIDTFRQLLGADTQFAKSEQMVDGYLMLDLITTQTDEAMLQQSVIY